MIGADGEAGGAEQRAVVFPARVGNQDRGVRVDLLQEVGADLQAAGAADGLHGGDTAAGDDLAVGPEHQTLHGLVIGGDAVDRQVAARLRRLEHLALGLDHALQQRQLAVVVVVDAHAQVDLGGVGVGTKLFVQTQDRVARGHFDGREQGHDCGSGKGCVVDDAPATQARITRASRSSVRLGGCAPILAAARESHEQHRADRQP